MTVEGVDGQEAAIGAALAVEGAALVGEVLELLCGEGGAKPWGTFVLLLGVEGTAVGAHQAGLVGAHYISSELELEGPEHGIVEEGAPLHNDPIAEQGGVGEADDLVECVLDDADGEAGKDVGHRSPILLRLLDRAVHEDGTTAAQVHRVPGGQRKAGRLLGGVAQGVGEGLQE